MTVELTRPARRRNWGQARMLIYLHWWTLTHYVFENPKCRQSAMVLVQRGGALEAFEQTIGPVAAVEPEWYRHVRRIKSALAGKDRNFHKTGQLPPDQ